LSYSSVRFNLFFEVVSLAAILIAHGTHGHSKEFVLGALLRPGGPKFDADGQQWGMGS